MRTGVCYYPEQWPRERWETDAAGMAELGLDLVRIGEFAWSSYEPARGRFEFGWLDAAIEVLASAGLQVVLGTPTATPPVWLVRERPEIVSVGPDGRARPYGSRRHTSTSSPAYREEAARIVEVLVGRYGRHPAVVAWQVDNEPGNHGSARCWSAGSERAFQDWLSARFDGDIDELNAAWGTAFWSMTYPSFDAVALPRPTLAAHSPSLEVAHLVFAAEQAAEGLAEQRAIITAGSPAREVFTNLYLADVDIDPRQVARPAGLGAVDLYPHGVQDPHAVGFLADLARGSALGPDAGPAQRGGRAWVVEQQQGQVNWTGDNPAVAAGQVRLWCWQAALHGIEALLFFRWRAPRAGPEQHPGGLLRHDGTRGPAWHEAARFVRELRAVQAAAPPLLERPAARVALVHDHLDAWMLEVVAQVPDADHRRLILAAHAAARRLGLDVDVVPDDADLTGYEVVLAPALHVATPRRIARLEAALDAGAQVVLGPRSLVRDEHAVWVEVPVPAGLAGRLGARLEHAGSPAGWPRAAEHRSRLVLDDPSAPLPVGGWIDTLAEVEATTEVLGRAHGGPLDGAPVVVRRGGLTYLGAGSEPAWTAVLTRLLGRRAHPHHLEVFDRDHGQVVIDHRALSVDGIGAQGPAGVGTT